MSTHSRELFDACYRGDVTAVENLICRPDVDFNASNDNGTTAIHIAAEHNKEEIVQILIAGTS